MSARPTPAIEPSSPACGTTLWINPPRNDIASLKMPMRIMHAIPTCHATIPASAGGMRVLAETNAGPRTVKAMPIVLGASRPSGIAVTSLRPSRRASRKARHVYTRSPNITPSAVPGNMRV